MTTPEIYNQTYKNGDLNQHHEAISFYMGNVQMSNQECENLIHRVGEYRQARHGSKAGTLAYVFSTGHPPLIMSFIDHVIRTLDLKDTESGKLYLININSLPEDFNWRNWREGIDQSKIWGGIMLDCNCKRWHIDRDVITLYELLETFKWHNCGGEFIHWLSRRERRDGRFAIKVGLSPNLWFKKRQTPGPPNEYVAMIRSLI
jgi:hypothetical protein